MFEVMLHLCLFLTALGVCTLAKATSQCLFKNGTTLPTGGVSDWYQPCPGTAIYCALNRDNPPGGNGTLGFTQDECLPNGLCQNRAITRHGWLKTEWVSLRFTTRSLLCMHEEADKHSGLITAPTRTGMEEDAWTYALPESPKSCPVMGQLPARSGVVGL